MHGCMRICACMHVPHLLYVNAQDAGEQQTYVARAVQQSSSKRERHSRMKRGAASCIIPKATLMQLTCNKKSVSRSKKKNDAPRTKQCNNIFTLCPSVRPSVTEKQKTTLARLPNIHFLRETNTPYMGQGGRDASRPWPLGRKVGQECRRFARSPPTRYPRPTPKNERCPSP